MAITTYAELQTAMNQFSHRSDITTAIYDNLISLTEQTIDAKLRVRTNNLRATATMPTTDRFLALPTAFQKMRSLIITSAVIYEVRYRAPEDLIVKVAPGRPKYYTVTNEIEFDRQPDSAYPLEMSYYRYTDPLTSSNTTNNVLDLYPNIYLYGVLHHLSNYEQDEQKAQYYLGLFEKALEDAAREERAHRHGPAPAMMSERRTP